MWERHHQCQRHQIANTQVSKPCWLHWPDGGPRLLSEVNWNKLVSSVDAISQIWNYQSMTHWQGYVLGDASTPKNPYCWDHLLLLNWMMQHRWPSKLALMPKHCLKGPSVDVLWVHKSARWNFEQYLTSPPGLTILWKSNQLLTHNFIDICK